MTPLAVGTSVRNLVFVLRYFFRQLQYLAHSVVYLRHADYFPGVAEKKLTTSAGCNFKPGWSGWQSGLGLDLQFVSLLLRSLAVIRNITAVIEGLATSLAGAASFWIIQDFPDTAKFLTEAERTVVIHRLQVDDQFSAAGESFKLKYIYQSITDWKTWVTSG